MVLPFSRLGVCAGRALADTVAGMVPNQNTAAPITARITTRIASLRSIGALSAAIGHCPAWSGLLARYQNQRADRRKTAAPIISNLKCLCRPLAVDLVATAAILAHLGD